ncbi:hypothetical protein [Candidatus Amarobacter glycogenicus]
MLDTVLIEYFQAKAGDGYQTINEALRQAMERQSGRRSTRHS